MPPLSWDLVVIFIALAILVPWRGQKRMRDLLLRPALEPVDRLVIYGSTMALQWLVAGITLWRCFSRGWAVQTLGLTLERPALAITLGLAMALVLAGMQVLSFRHLSRLPPAQRGYLYEVGRKLMPQSMVETLPYVALVCTVAVCEEFLYRGFVFAMIARLAQGSLAAAVVGSSLLFAFGHLYQGRRGMASTFVVGGLFALARLWTFSLVPAIIAHLAVDLAAGLAAPRAFWESDQPGQGDGSRSDIHT